MREPPRRFPGTFAAGRGFGRNIHVILIGSKLTQLKTLAAVARSFVDRAMMAQLGGRLSPDQAAMAKWWTSDALGKVVDECLQLHGGYGYMSEYPIARMWADARIARIYGGSNETMKSIIAKTMQPPGRSGGRS